MGLFQYRINKFRNLEVTMIYVLIALKSELPDNRLDDSKFKVLYTGVGKVNATMVATMAAVQSDCEAIVNFGTAGCLNSELAGKLNKVSLVRQRDMDARPQADLGVTPFEETGLQGIIKVAESGVVLSTGDNFVTEQPELESDLVDMEGYAIAKVAKHFHKPCLMLKYGSDMADEEAAKTWEENQADGAEAFLEYMDTLASND